MAYVLTDKVRTTRQGAHNCAPTQEQAADRMRIARYVAARFGDVSLRHDTLTFEHHKIAARFPSVTRVTHLEFEHHLLVAPLSDDVPQRRLCCRAFPERDAHHRTDLRPSSSSGAIAGRSPRNKSAPVRI
jgi:hypothetical protein